MSDQNMPQWLQAAFEEQARQSAEMANQYTRQVRELAAQNAEAVAMLANRIDAYEGQAQTQSGPTEDPTPSPLLPASLDPTVRRPRPSLPDPDKFDGKNLALYPQFESMLKAKLEIDCRTIGGENEQVWYAFGRLSGEAAGRIHPWMVHAQRTSTLAIDGFLKQIRLAFSDPRASQKALEQINRTKQGLRPFNDFLNEFNRLILEAEGWSWDDKMKKAYLRAAISYKLKDRTIGMNEESSYEEYCSQLRMISDQLADLKNGSNHRSPWGKARSPSPPKGPNPDAMDWEPSTAVAATRTKRKEPRWAPPEEINRRYEENLCLRCGKEGHIVRHCKTVLKAMTMKEVNAASVSKKEETGVRAFNPEESDDSGNE
jgi:hypothetical protein